MVGGLRRCQRESGPGILRKHPENGRPGHPGEEKDRGQGEQAADPKKSQKGQFQRFREDVSEGVPGPERGVVRGVPKEL